MRKLYLFICIITLFIFNSTLNAQKDDSGDNLLHSDNTAETLLIKNYPNPFSSEITIEFKLQKNEKVRINVFDLTGRLVTTLIEKDILAGPYSLQWDGMNSGGTEVSKGIYYYCIEAGDKKECYRIIKTD